MFPSLAQRVCAPNGGIDRIALSTHSCMCVHQQEGIHPLYLCFKPAWDALLLLLLKWPGIGHGRGCTLAADLGGITGGCISSSPWHTPMRGTLDSQQWFLFPVVVPPKLSTHTAANRHLTCQAAAVHLPMQPQTVHKRNKTQVVFFRLPGLATDIVVTRQMTLFRPSVKTRAVASGGVSKTDQCNSSFVQHKSHLDVCLGSRAMGRLRAVCGQWSEQRRICGSCICVHPCS